MNVCIIVHSNEWSWMELDAIHADRMVKNHLVSPRHNNCSLIVTSGYASYQTSFIISD